MDYTNRIKRLTHTLQLLSKGNGVSTPALVEFFGEGVTKKMVQTDFKEYLLPLFDAEELAIISIIKNKSKDKYSDDGLSQKVDVMFDKFEDELSNRLYQKSSVEKIDNFRDEIIQIKNAIETKHIITCSYKNKNRTVYPLKILNLEGYWYLIVYEPKDDLVKTFHLNSVKNIEHTDEVYNFSQDIIDSFDNAITAYFKPNNEPIRVELYIDKEVSRFFERKPLNKSQHIIRKLPDKSLELEVYVTDLMEIIPTIQRFIPYVAVVEPEELKAEIVKNLEIYSKFYE